MVYRLLALDIDGTLLHSNHRLARSTKDAVNFAMKKGVAVTLVTERHFHSAARVAKALKLKHPIVTHSGAFVSAHIDNPLYTQKIEYETLLPLIEFLEHYPIHVRIAHERLAVSNRPKEKKLMARMTVGMNEPLFYPMTYVDSLTAYLHENIESATDVVMRVEDQEAKLLLEEIAQKFPSIEGQKHADGEWRLTRLNTSKYSGLVHLANHLGIRFSEVVAVGDGLDDLEMIEKAGLGVAMGHAPKAVRNKADWITRTNDMDGVAYCVKEVFRKQIRVKN